MLASTIDGLRHALFGKQEPELTRRLYAPLTHWFMRITCAAMSIGFVGLALHTVQVFMEHGFEWRVAAGATPVLMGSMILFATYGRTSVMHGSPDGLHIARWGKRRVVPWSSVGTAEFAWWSAGWVRLAKVSIDGDDESAVSFFATKRILAELDAMRALYGRK